MPRAPPRALPAPNRAPPRQACSPCSVGLTLFGSMAWLASSPAPACPSHRDGLDLRVVEVRTWLEPAPTQARGAVNRSFSRASGRATASPLDGYPGPVSSQRIPSGVEHKLPADLRKALIANPTALDAWKDITPLARNEFICWVEDAKQETTRERRIHRTQEELEEGQRRPCCWPGCRHRERTAR